MSICPQCSKQNPPNGKKFAPRPRAVRSLRGAPRRGNLPDHRQTHKTFFDTDLHAIHTDYDRDTNDESPLCEPRNTRTTQRGLRPQPTSDSRKDAKSAKRTTTRTPLNRADLCVFARNLILFTSRPYVSLARKSAQENKILTSSNAKEPNNQSQIIHNQFQAVGWAACLPMRLLRSNREQTRKNRRTICLFFPCPTPPLRPQYTQRTRNRPRPARPPGAAVVGWALAHADDNRTAEDAGDAEKKEREQRATSPGARPSESGVCHDHRKSRRLHVHQRRPHDLRRAGT